MSGGHFEYKQYYIDDIADSIEREIEKATKPKPPKAWKEYQDFEDGEYCPEYTDETIEIMKDAVKALRKAAIYAQRIDWFLSGDDGEESLKERLEEELKELEDEQ